MSSYVGEARTCIFTLYIFKSCECDAHFIQFVLCDETHAIVAANTEYIGRRQRY